MRERWKGACWVREVRRREVMGGLGAGVEEGGVGVLEDVVWQGGAGDEEGRMCVAAVK